MFKRGTVSGALLRMTVSAAAFYSTSWAIPLIPESYFVHKPNWVYLPPVIQIPKLVVVGASVLGVARLKRHKPAPAAADPRGGGHPRRRSPGLSKRL